MNETPNTAQLHEAIQAGRALDIAGSVVIITGAGQGIGRAFAKAFAAAGALPVIAEINADKGAAVADEVKALGGKALAVATDVTDPASVQSMTDAAVRAFGKIDVLINNAGILAGLEMRPFDQIPLDEWERVLKVNITGQFLCCRAVVPVMRKARYGRIINMSSGSILMGRPNYMHYTTSKAALIGMTRSMARELGPSGITVNAILPGATFTEIERKTVSPEQKQAIIASQCVQRAETPDDLVGVALFLASRASEFITGQSINADGGCRHI